MRYAADLAGVDPESGCEKKLRQQLLEEQWAEAYARLCAATAEDREWTARREYPLAVRDRHLKWAFESFSGEQGLTCPECGGPMSSKKRATDNCYFSHINQDAARDCPGSQETIAHLAAKAVIAEARGILLPSYMVRGTIHEEIVESVIPEGHVATLKSIEIEKWRRSGYRPDVTACFRPPGLPAEIEDMVIAIEVVVTHPIAEETLQKMKEDRANVLEISLSTLTNACRLDTAKAVAGTIHEGMLDQNGYVVIPYGEPFRNYVLHHAKRQWANFHADHAERLVLERQLRREMELHEASIARAKGKTEETEKTIRFFQSNISKIGAKVANWPPNIMGDVIKARDALGDLQEDEDTSGFVGTIHEAHGVIGKFPAFSLMTADIPAVFLKEMDAVLAVARQDLAAFGPEPTEGFETSNAGLLVLHVCRVRAEEEAARLVASQERRVVDLKSRLTAMSGSLDDFWAALETRASGSLPEVAREIRLGVLRAREAAANAAARSQANAEAAVSRGKLGRSWELVTHSTPIDATTAQSEFGTLFPAVMAEALIHDHFPLPTLAYDPGERQHIGWLGGPGSMAEAAAICLWLVIEIWPPRHLNGHLLDIWNIRIGPERVPLYEVVRHGNARQLVDAALEEHLDEILAGRRNWCDLIYGECEACRFGYPNPDSDHIQGPPAEVIHSSCALAEKMSMEPPGAIGEYCPDGPPTNAPGAGQKDMTMTPAGNVVRFETRSDFIIRILGGDTPPAPCELRRIDEILFPMIRATLDLGGSFALESQAEEFRQFKDRLDHLSAMIRGEVERDSDLEIRVRQILDEYAASFATIFSGEGLRKT